jgi:hypothetical protein
VNTATVTPSEVEESLDAYGGTRCPQRVGTGPAPIALGTTRSTCCFHALTIP